MALQESVATVGCEDVSFKKGTMISPVLGISWPRGLIFCRVSHHHYTSLGRKGTKWKGQGRLAAVPGSDALFWSSVLLRGAMLTLAIVAENGHSIPSSQPLHSQFFHHHLQLYPSIVSLLLIANSDLQISRSVAIHPDFRPGESWSAERLKQHKRASRQPLKYISSNEDSHHQRVENLESASLVFEIITY